MTASPVTPGETRRRITYRLRVVGFLPGTTSLVVVEAIDDNLRRSVVPTAEVESWPVVDGGPLAVCFHGLDHCGATASNPCVARRFRKGTR